MTPREEGLARGRGKKYSRERILVLKTYPRGVHDPCTNRDR
jgi:hypothetical protein